jgi:hypothetical protein
MSTEGNFFGRLSASSVAPLALSVTSYLTCSCCLLLWILAMAMDVLSAAFSAQVCAALSWRVVGKVFVSVLISTFDALEAVCDGFAFIERSGKLFHPCDRYSQGLDGFDGF